MKKIFLISILAFSAAASADELNIVESVPAETVYGSAMTLRPVPVWLEMINSARKSLDIEEFYVETSDSGDLAPVIEAIKSRAAAGVRVRIIFDKAMLFTSSKYLPLFSGENIEVRIIDFKKIHGGVQHSKFFVADGEQVYTGSQNFDWRSLSQIHELGVVIKSRKAAEDFSAVFNADWEMAENPNKKAKIKTSISCKKPLKASLNGSEVSFCLAFSPKGGGKYNSEIEEMIRLINSARKNIFGQVMTYSDRGKFNELEKAFIAAAERGVKVRLIFSDWALGPKKDSAIRKLSRCKNIEIKISSIPEFSGGFIPFARVEHLKYISADGSSLLVSSSNWGRDYFYQTRGASVIITGAAAGVIASDIFERGWNSPYVYVFDPSVEYKAKKRS